MAQKKKDIPKIKSKLHPRNKHNTRYDFDKLVADCPDLADFVRPNLHGDDSIDFADPVAVKMLNSALLIHHYGIVEWDIPEGYLCPPIPGRADYIHHISSLLQHNNYGKIPTGSKIKVFDVGTGANCIYPIIGNTEYEWSFIGSDIDKSSIENAQRIITANKKLSTEVELRFQEDAKKIFDGVLKADERIDISLCNPPFHSSFEEAQEGSKRKLKNLKLNKTEKPVLNFGGKNNELWCTGGEEQFISNMIMESKKIGDQCFWFSSIVSKHSLLTSLSKKLEDIGASKIEVIPMGQGNKISRILAWTFLSYEAQKEWRNSRWNNQEPSK